MWTFFGQILFLSQHHFSMKIFMTWKTWICITLLFKCWARYDFCLWSSMAPKDNWGTLSRGPLGQKGNTNPKIFEVYLWWDVNSDLLSFYSCICYHILLNFAGWTLSVFQEGQKAMGQSNSPVSGYLSVEAIWMYNWGHICHVAEDKTSGRQMGNYSLNCGCWWQIAAMAFWMDKKHKKIEVLFLSFTLQLFCDCLKTELQQGSLNGVLLFDSLLQVSAGNNSNKIHSGAAQYFLWMGPHSPCVLRTKWWNFSLFGWQPCWIWFDWFFWSSWWQQGKCYSWQRFCSKRQESCRSNSGWNVFLDSSIWHSQDSSNLYW